MKIKLTVGQVIDGAVWPADSVVDIPEDEAMKLIGADIAVPLTVADEAEPSPTPYASTAGGVPPSAQHRDDEDGA